MLFKLVEVQLMVKRDLIPAAAIKEDHNLLWIAFIPFKVGINALTCKLLHCFVFLIAAEGSVGGEERAEGRVNGCAGAH